jgi:hypothetical protein
LVRKSTTELDFVVRSVAGIDDATARVYLKAADGSELINLGLAFSASESRELVNAVSNVDLDTMRIVMAGSSYLEVASESSGACLLRSPPFVPLFDAYFEFYPTFSVENPLESGEFTRLQCCVDQECKSACKYCHAVGGGTMCSTDCGSAERRVATQCNCDDVSGYTNFPEGYSASMISTEFTSLTVVTQSAWDAQTWDCGEGGRSVGGLREGKHEFGARTVDRGLHTSGDPLLHRWTIDATPPVAGFVRFPEPVVSASAVPAWQYHADEATNTFACTLGTGENVPCPSSDVDSPALLPVNITAYGLRDGEQSLAIQATDAAGNSGANVAVTWTVDDVAPLATLLQVETVGDALLAAAVVEPGATVHCSLTGTTTSAALQVLLTSCTHPVSPDHCPELAITGNGPPGVVGPYFQRWCPAQVPPVPPGDGSGGEEGAVVADGEVDGEAAGAAASGMSASGSGDAAPSPPTPKVPDVPCMVEDRAVYEHHDSRILLQYQQGRWALFENGTAVATISTAAGVPTAISASTVRCSF